MIVKLAEHYGLCFGVRDAIAQAEQLAAAGPLTILGELVTIPSSANASPRAAFKKARSQEMAHRRHK